MLPDWESYAWENDLRSVVKLHPLKKRQLAMARLRKVAVELFEEEIGRAVLEQRETIMLPASAAKVILACAKGGQHRGQGRRRPEESTNDRVARLAVIRSAQRRWAEFGGRRGTKLQAAQEILDEDRGGMKLGKLVNLSPESLVQLMGPKPKS